MKSVEQLKLEYKAIPPEAIGKILKFLWDNKYEILTFAIWIYNEIVKLLTKKKEKKNGTNTNTGK